jgi:Arrestin (or S-antigen), C-terminal domain
MIALSNLVHRFTNTLASTTLKSSPTERNFFAIYVTYYVKVRLIINGVGGDVSVKVPFILMRDGPEPNEGEVEQSNNKPAVEQCAERTNTDPSEITEPSEPAEPSEQAENLENCEPHEGTTTPVPGDLQNPFVVANGSPDSSECSSPIDPMMEQQLDVEEKTDQVNKF